MNISQNVLDKMGNLINDHVYVHQESETNHLNRNYTDLQLIGEGTFGDVYKGKKVNTGELFAIKVITLEFDLDYADRNVHSTSVRDSTMLRRVLENCQEAVLQSEVLTHTRIVKVHEKWIQQVQNGPENELSDNLFEIVNSVKSGAFEMTEKFRNALVKTEGRLLDKHT